MVTFGNKFCTLVQKMLLICHPNYVLFCYAQITCLVPHLYKERRMQLYYILRLMLFQDLPVSIYILKAQQQYHFHKAISKGVCVVVILEFEIIFNCQLSTLIKISLKIIPIPTKSNYLKCLTEKTKNFIRRLRWKAYHFCKSNLQQ